MPQLCAAALHAGNLAAALWQTCLGALHMFTSLLCIMCNQPFAASKDGTVLGTHCSPMRAVLWILGSKGRRPGMRSRGWSLRQATGLCQVGYVAVASQVTSKGCSTVLYCSASRTQASQHAHDMFGDKSTCLLFPQATCLMLLLLLTGSKLRSDAPEFRPTEIPRAAARTEPSHRGGDTPREGAASEDASRRTVQQSSAARTPNGSDKEAQDADATPR